MDTVPEHERRGIAGGESRTRVGGVREAEGARVGHHIVHETNRSKTFTPGLPPMAASSAAFIEAAISVARPDARGPELSTAGTRPMSGIFHTTRFAAPASSSSPTIVAMSVA